MVDIPTITSWFAQRVPEPRVARLSSRLPAAAQQPVQNLWRLLVLGISWLSFGANYKENVIICIICTLW